MKSIAAVVYTCALSVSCVCAQGIGGSGGAGNGSFANGKWNGSSPALKRTLITGTVKSDDGSPLPGSLNIQMVCGGTEMTVAQTNVLNDFGFQISRETGSQGLEGSFALLSGITSDAAGVRGLGTSMSDCDLRADLASYRSSSLRLNPSAFEALHAGTIWVHRVGKASSGNVVSISTLAAPRDAVKQFEKGQQLMRESKLPEAVVSFHKAVKIYPRFAEAWLLLGTVQYKMRALSDAEEALLQARDIDPRLPGIYQILGYMAYDRRDWNATVRYLDQAEHLNPGSALPWYVSAVAYYELHRLGDAERSIRQEMKLDSRSEYRRAQYLLGLILVDKGEVYAGTQALQAYLAGSPDPRDVERARAVLARTELIAAK